MPYRVITTKTFEDVFSKRHKDKKQILDSIISKLEKYPDKYGKPLRGRLHGIWQVRMGTFRIWYEINEKEKLVTLRAIHHKDEAVEMY